MKRSEMVKEIESRLKTIIGISNQDDNYIAKEADWLLGQLENLGMLPPHNGNYFQTDNYLDKYEWDKEDEEKEG